MCTDATISFKYLSIFNSFPHKWMNELKTEKYLKDISAYGYILSPTKSTYGL